MTARSKRWSRIKGVEAMVDMEQGSALDKASADPRDGIAVYPFYPASIYSIVEYFCFIRFISINFLAIKMIWSNSRKKIAKYFYSQFFLLTCAEHSVTKSKLLKDDPSQLSLYTFYRILSGMFSEVSHDKISLKIIRQMRDAVLTGKLKAGDHLPPEKELLTQFGVSKHTLREALRALEIMGLIDIRKGAGGGPVVMEVGRETIHNSITNFLHFKNVSIQDLSEVRKVLEPYLARMAARRLQPETLEKLRSMNAACRKTLSLGKNITSGKDEIDFHILLAETSDNPVLVLILDFVNSLLTEIKKKLKPGLPFSEQVLAAHERVLDALQAGDSSRASDEMYAHVCEVEEGLMKLLQENGGEEISDSLDD
jgi:GntR family transcriptional repressor for pyruvate dehydrogenase complex